MATRAVNVTSSVRRSAKPAAAGPRAVRKQAKNSKGVIETQIDEALTAAKKLGLLSGVRDKVVRGRMPAKLVAEAKRKSGITSDSKLLEAALANIATADDYWEWFHAGRGAVDSDLDLEF
jgi:hypothetical protein